MPSTSAQVSAAGTGRGPMAPSWVASTKTGSSIPVAETKRAAKVL